MQTYRRISQGIFFLTFLFLFLQTESKGADQLGYPVKIFLDFDPLLLISTFLSSHAISPGWYYAFFIILITGILGRFFCGWICPLGTLNTVFGSLRKGRPLFLRKNWYQVKYCLLIFFLVSSLFTLQLSGIMDPLALLIRSFSVSIFPAFNYALRAFFDSVYELNPPVVVSWSEALYALLKKSILAFQQPFFHQGLFVGLLFVLIISLNLVETRFWCRYLCPLGALLGIVSRYSFVNRSVSEGCNSCDACATVCHGNAQPQKRESRNSAECIRCMNCDDLCPQKAVGFGFTRKPARASLDLGKRHVVTAVTAGVITVPFLRITAPSRSSSVNPWLLRPPGSREEKEFLRRCVRCGECMKVCITNGLQPAFLDAGLEGIWTPLLSPRIGPCEYRCTLCGQVCPTGAIKNLPLADKEKVRIGLAMIDRGRCLPYAHSIPCIVCEEVCPTPKKAIWLSRKMVTDREGKEVMVKQPNVDLRLCIGCGVCEAKCPIIGDPAIYVISTGESRSKENQLLLF